MECNNVIPQADLPLVDGKYEWADGKSVSTYDSTVVAVHTDKAEKDLRPHFEVQA